MGTGHTGFRTATEVGIQRNRDRGLRSNRIPSVIPENWAMVYELHFKIKKAEVTNKQEKETRCQLTGERCGRKHFP